MVSLNGEVASVVRSGTREARKAGAGALAWETAWVTLIPWVSRDGQGRDLTWITISRSELRLSEPMAPGQCKPGRVRMEISVTSVSVTTGGEGKLLPLSMCLGVLWVAQICRAIAPDPCWFIWLLSLHTHIWGHKGDLNVGICIMLA